MAVEAKDKVITVELAGSIADAQKAYIDNAVKDLPTNEDLLEAASSEEIQGILDKFSVEA